MSANLFHQYYDAFYADKDYASETDLVFSLARKAGTSAHKVLEIGCGTGNHTQNLNKQNIELVAIDTDPEMIAVARKKLADAQNVSLLHISIENLQQQDFDLALAMFHVITYISDQDQLLTFFQGVARCLKPDGVFIFDCWNGVAVLQDPPKNKSSEIKIDNKQIRLNISPKNDLLNQKVTLTYDVQVTEPSGNTQKDQYSFDQILWTPMQINWALQKAGLVILSCSAAMKPDQPAIDKDWKIMYCCQKKN